METRRNILKRFIVLEGVDGSGTSTQMSILGQRLAKAGEAYNLSAEPTRGQLGLLIRDALSGSRPLLPETVARLFAADRGEHLFGPAGIAENLSGGNLVISDRYLFSSLAYQGLTCEPDLPARLNEDFPLPELLLFFDIHPELSMARLDGRGSRDIYETAPFQERVAQAYRKVISGFRDSGMRIVEIDASRPVDEVSAAVWSAISSLLDRENPI